MSQLAVASTVLPNSHTLPAENKCTTCICSHDRPMIKQSRRGDLLALVAESLCALGGELMAIRCKCRAVTFCRADG